MYMAGSPPPPQPTPQPCPVSSVNTRDIKNRHHIDKIEAHKPSLISLVKINELVFAVFVHQQGSSRGVFFFFFPPPENRLEKKK